MCLTNSNRLTEVAKSADEDFEINNCDCCNHITRTKTNKFENRVQRHQSPDDVKRKSCRKERYHSKSETFDHYTKESQAKYEKSDKFYKKTEESRRDFYRFSSQDDRFESESADVQERLSGLISGSDYHYYSYRKKCLEYVHFYVKSKRAFWLGCNNANSPFDNDGDFDAQTTESRDYRYQSKAETTEDYKSNSTSTNESDVRVSMNLKKNLRRINEISTETSESKRKHNGVYFESRKFNRDESLSSRKTLRRIDNFEYSRKSQGNSSLENTCYAKLTTIEETLKMSKSSRSVKIRSSSHEPTSINRFEMARVKKCAQILFRDSADDTSMESTASEFLCNKDDTRLHACESAYNEIYVRVERVTWIYKIRITVRRRERFY